MVNTFFKEGIDTGSALKPADVTSNINERAKYTANTGQVLISTANTNVNGTGTIGTVITGASNGTLIKKITIQARGNTTKGMIRFYIYNPYSGLHYSLDETDVPATIQSGTQPAWSITYDVDYYIQDQLSLMASTEKGETFAITAEGLNYTY